ncbi:MAG: hypothetical protein M3Y21_05790 [Candidatus Eremiobacteraeota bacterium]|nr:hypothetical protein [Candidatus Eremiobacteraeota bacterium]
MSLLLCTISGLLLPLTAQSSMNAVNGEPSEIDYRKFPTVSIGHVSGVPVLLRDPFVPDRSRRTQPADATGPGPLGMQVTAGQPMGIGLPAGSAAGPGGVVVRAVITGRNASALVESADGVRVVSVGDRIAGRRIIAIAAGGVLVTGKLLYPLAQRAP